MICFCFNIAKRPLRYIHAQDDNRNQSLPAFAQRNSFVSVFNKVENTLLLNFCLAMCRAGLNEREAPSKIVTARPLNP